MERYPCDTTQPCPLREKSGCFEDVHHKYWPKKMYRTVAEKAFRNLDMNKEISCRQRHNEIHANQQSATKPGGSEIKAALGGQYV